MPDQDSDPSHSADTKLEIPLLTGLPADLKVAEDLVTYVDTQLDKNFDRIERGLMPLMEGQREAGKTLISLASGALVLSLTVVQFLSSQQGGFSLLWLLFTAWTCFIVTVLSGIIRHNWTGHIQGFRLGLESVRNVILLEVRNITPGPTALRDISKVLERHLSAPLIEFGKSLRGHDVFTYIMLGSFILGLIALCFFAGFNL